MENQYLYKFKANHWKNGEAVGGNLYIYEKKILFKSHKFNFQPHSLEVSYDDIKEIKFSNTLFIVPNGLTIFTKSGEKEVFVIASRKKVKNLIEEKIAA